MTHDHEHDFGDVPEEIKALFGEIIDLADTEHQFTLTTKDLTLLGMGLDGLIDAIPKNMRGAEPEKVQMLSVMMADTVTLRNRLETVIRAEAGEAMERANRALGGDA